ncbi:MAG TPA: ribosome-associated translation inhibitor RaiA [Rickettsiales bacterium]|nr:ribosome-associated translation inhibitor RaiA [Rickettsiales bacterium]
MKVNVSGSVDVGEAFPNQIKDQLEEKISKYFANEPVIDIHFNKQNEIIHTNINVNGYKINADGESIDIRTSFEGALDKLIIQLRKEKDKLITKKKQGNR